MSAGVKRLEKRGFFLYEDSNYYIFERKELGTKLFDQIKIRLGTGAVKCTTYILTDDGYKEEPLTLDEELISGILIVLKDIQRRKKDD